MSCALSLMRSLSAEWTPITLFCMELQRVIRHNAVSTTVSAYMVSWVHAAAWLTSAVRLNITLRDTLHCYSCSAHPLQNCYQDILPPLFT